MIRPTPRNKKRYTHLTKTNTLIYTRRDWLQVVPGAHHRNEMGHSEI
jgi:hypothetical protein